MRGHGEGSVRKRIRADGSVFWEARVRINARQFSFYDDTKTGALAKARQARVDAERGLARPRASLTVEAYLRQWLEVTARHSVRARTYTSYRQHAEVHVIPAIGHIRLDDLKPGHVQSMLARIIASGRSVGTAQRVRAMLSSALHAAQSDYGLPRNVASLAKIPRTDRPSFRPEIVTPQDARRIIEAFAGTPLEPLVLFAISTGLRQGELLALRWCDIDLQRRTVSVTHAVDIRDGKRVLARPKTERAQRVLALPDLAVRALDIRRAQEAQQRLLAGRAWQDLNLVFAGPTGGIRDGHAVTRTFKRHLARCGLRPIRWHALRRVFAALLQDQGTPLTQVRDLMGHSQVRVTETYAYNLPSSLAGSMRGIDQALSTSRTAAANEGRMRVR